MTRALFAVLSFWLAIKLFGYFLDYLNLRYSKAFAHSPPPPFEGLIDRSLLERATSYLREKTHFRMVASALTSAAVVLFLFAGPLDAYDSLIASVRLPFTASGWLFFVVLYLAWEIFSIPFSLYDVFHIENRYGFNTMSYRAWLLDLAKGTALSLLFLSAAVLGGLWLVEASARFWWLWVWCFWLAFAAFVTYIAPYVIEPLFNKFTPVEDGPLKTRMIELSMRAGINVSKVLAMDASKRSRHTNAYFTGLGKTKRIVLFDTLLASMAPDEILAVLAHEIGHWRKRHLLKGLALSALVSIVFLFWAHEAISLHAFRVFFAKPLRTFYAEAVIVGFLASQLSFLFKPAMNGLSRRFEAEADRFSCAFGEGEALVGALVKLSKDNLSNLYPHPLYALFHYSHPPVLKRIRDIRSCDLRPGQARGERPG